MQPSTTLQRQVSDYLKYELYHALGAYGIAETRQESLALRCRPSEADEGGESPVACLAKLAQMACEHNRELANHRYGGPRERGKGTPLHDISSPAHIFREPRPTRLPLSQSGRFEIPVANQPEDPHDQPWRDPNIWMRIPQFYAEAILALRDVAGLPDPRNQTDEQRRKAAIASSILARFDRAPPPRGEGGGILRARPDRVEMRLLRYVERLKVAHRNLAVDGADESDVDLLAQYGSREHFLEELCSHNFETDSDSLSMFVIRVAAEAHLSMHAVEAWQRMCLGEYASRHTDDARKWLRTELDRCITLDTFVFCISRTAPWLFAATPSSVSKYSMIRPAPGSGWSPPGRSGSRGRFGSSRCTGAPPPAR